MSDKLLRENLLEVLTKGAAHVSFEKSIQNIPAEMRGKKAGEGHHSIYQELEHIRIAMEDLINYTLDPNWKSPDWPKDFWPPDNDKIPDDAWNKTISGIRKEFNKTVDLVNNTSVDLTSEIPHGEGRTYIREILLIIDHNSYHLGKILSARKALGIWDVSL